MTDGDTAWLLVSTGLVMLMTPGLALFYGGMVQGKNVLSTFMHSFFALGLVSVQFAVLGYTLAFGTSCHGVIGGLAPCALPLLDPALHQHHRRALGRVIPWWVARPQSPPPFHPAAGR